MNMREFNNDRKLTKQGEGRSNKHMETKTRPHVKTNTEHMEQNGHQCGQHRKLGLVYFILVY